MENMSDRWGNGKFCVAKGSRGGVKCRKQSDDLLEKYAHRREAVARGRLSGWWGREIELAQCHPPYTNQWTGSNGWEIERGKVEKERKKIVEREGRQVSP